MLGTAIQCIKQASAELGLPIPLEAAASREQQAVQMLALLNSAGNELCRMYEWQFLRKSASITLIAGQSGYPLPPDFVKLLNDSLWEKSNIYSVIGPVSVRQWAYLTNSVTIAPDYCFIIKDRQFQFTPAPGGDGMGTGDISYEFISNGWVQDTNNPAHFIPIIENDNDILQFDFWLCVKFLKLKTWEAKGLDTTSLRDDFMRAFSDITAQDQGAPNLTIPNRRRYDILPLGVPETGFGGVTGTTI
jgi:hypothetical protein